jgi:twitching motility protein PilJ|tara:strand:+ start:1369 stop:3678 length:2310 start_codon:yes stop_codon:yes gene_type:complete
MSAKRAETNLPTNRGAIFLAVLLIAALAGFIYTGYVVLQDGQRDAEYLDTAGDLRVLMQQISASSREATDGNAEAFERLERSRSSFDKRLKSLANGAEVKAMLAGNISGLDLLWDGVDEASKTIVSNRDRILFLREVALTLNESIPVLQQEYNFVVEILIESGGLADQVVLAQRQSWLAERIARNVDKMLEGGDGAKDAADQFNLDASLFGSVLAGMLEGNAAMRIRKIDEDEAVQSLTQISELYDFVNSSVDEIFQASPELLKSREAADKILTNSPAMQTQLTQLTEEVGSLGSVRPITGNTVLIIGGFIIAILVMFAFINFRNTRARLNAEEETNEANQIAILRLLDELSNLADGDLTSKATVSEDFTGAIADSINFTIDQLRILVSRINETAVEVSDSAETTQGTALHLAEAAEHQAQEIAGASAAINEMAVTIDQVSSNASESAAVAERSVKIANTGAEVVQSTIDGMDTIREQIQDTAKRIKRLGESSQEIGDIVSLINDIADQTNILSLNAAIQASMAGDAGRGFAVVADEVQRLAERSSAATKQIEALVKTIQSDTNEAVISMEQTTAEVVRGARLAQDAGVALEEIETVSANLAELIQNISNAARQQAASAGHISNTMNVIQEITLQTSSGTTETASSIGTLAEMAVQLRTSVEGFKLPEDDSAFDQLSSHEPAAYQQENELAVFDSSVEELDQEDTFEEDGFEIDELSDTEDFDTYEQVEDSVYAEDEMQFEGESDELDDELDGFLDDELGSSDAEKKSD